MTSSEMSVKMFYLKPYECPGDGGQTYYIPFENGSGHDIVLVPGCWVWKTGQIKNIEKNSENEVIITIEESKTGNIINYNLDEFNKNCTLDKMSFPQYNIIESLFEDYDIYKELFKNLKREWKDNGIALIVKDIQGDCKGHVIPAGIQQIIK